MKKLLLVAALMFGATAANATVYEVCHSMALENCSSASSEDFDACYEMSFDLCMDGIDIFKLNKSNPQCIQECLLIEDEARLNLCLTTCSPQ
jgi:hypothetical protein